MKKHLIGAISIAALLIAGSIDVQAQTKALKHVVKSSVNHFRAMDIVGTWYYQGVDIKFETESLLKKAGGSVATSRMEKKLNKQLTKLGFQPGVSVFTFNEDGTFSNVNGGTKMNGKYTFDNNSGEITLKYLNHIPVKAKVSGSGSKMSFLYEANGFLSLVSFIGGHSGISVIKKVTSIVNSYDGMLVGMEFSK